MLRNITLGQYFPGTSIVHRLDPRAKLIASFCYIIAIFTAKHYISYGILIALLFVGIALSSIRFSVFVKGLKPVVIIICFTAIMNLFFTKGGGIIYTIGAINIYYDGLLRAIFMMLRVLMLLLSTLLLTYTTSPLMLTDGLDYILAPLKKLKVPVHDFTMIMSIALRFIPTLIQETEKIISAQKARGADFDSGNLLRRAKALVPILIPLFVSAFRRADELAVAMDCRCYHEGMQRTRLRVLKYTNIDIALISLSLCLCVLIGTLRYFGL